MDLSNLNISVVGLGLIGGSYALALKELRPQKLWGIDKDTNTLEQAQKCGIICSDNISKDEILAQSDIVIIALYPENTVKFIRENLNKFKSGAVITDTAGIKGELVREIQDFLRFDLDFVGGHPMAGKAENGFCNADKSLYRGCNYILTPTSANKPESVELITAIAVTLGSKKIIKITPEEHDRIIAYTSHLPHITAVSLINSMEDIPNLSAFIGGSFKDSTRVAVINSDLWCELFRLNKNNIIDVLESFEKAISNLKAAIASDDEEYLRDAFKSATLGRREIN